MPEEKKKGFEPKAFSACIKEFFDKLHGLRFDHLQMQNIENCSNDLIELGNWFVKTHEEWLDYMIKHKLLSEGETFLKIIKTYIMGSDALSEESKAIHVREKLAVYAHEAWSGWMRHLFKICEEEAPADAIPQWAIERWKRQMTTKYKDLPEEEKKSDREEADRMLKIMKGEK